MGSATVIAIDPRIALIGDALTAQEIEWAVAGGWAIDMFLGRVTRRHADVDLVVWRDQHQQLREALPGWRFSIAEAGQLRRWLPGTLLAPPLHEIHARSSDDGSAVELLLNDRRDGFWLYRRNPDVRLPLPNAVLHCATSPFLAPEIVLLYKSKEPRATDEADFHNALPHLSINARKWLAEALSLTNADHPWTAMLHTAHI